MSQKRLQLGHILIRKMLRVVCIFLIQIIFYECCQRIAGQFKIFMSFKETLQVFQHSGCHLVRTGRKDGTYHDKSQQNCRQQCGPKLLHAAFVFVHITPPVIHILHCYTHQRPTRDNHTFNIIPRNYVNVKMFYNFIYKQPFPASVGAGSSLLNRLDTFLRLLSLEYGFSEPVLGVFSVFADFL